MPHICFPCIELCQYMKCVDYCTTLYSCIEVHQYRNISQYLRLNVLTVVHMYSVFVYTVYHINKE